MQTMQCVRAFVLVLNAVMMAVTTSCYPLEMQQDDEVQLQQTSNETSLLQLQFEIFDASSNEPPPTKNEEECKVSTTQECAFLYV